MRAMQPISKDNCDFPTLRQSGCIYVDKTAWFHRLATDREAHSFFLARPRRFGKSLMISTLKAIFEGRKELFKGLAISKMKWDWKKKHPSRHPPQHGDVRGGRLFNGRTRQFRGGSALPVKC